MLENFKSNITAPVLAALSFGLLLLARITGVADRGNEYLNVIILQLLVLAFPAILYSKLRGNALKGKLRAATRSYLSSGAHCCSSAARFC